MKRRTSPLAALLLLAVLLTAAWTPPPQTVQLTVSGQIVNSTPGGSVDANMPVTLYVYSNMEQVGSYTSSASADGSFRFEGITTVAGDTLIAETSYQDVLFFSAPLTVEAEMSEASLSLPIYEANEEPTGVEVTQLHLFMTSMGDTLQVAEYYLVSNMGDQAYVGSVDAETGRRVTLAFSLPEGATHLSFDGAGLGERFLERDGGFVDTEPVAPGMSTAEVLFRYELPFEEGLQVERSFAFPIVSVVLVITEQGMGLAGDDLVSTGAMNTQMGAALSYTAGPLEAGESFSFELVEQPAGTSMPGTSSGSGSAAATPTRDAGRELTVGLVVLVLGAATAYLLWRITPYQPMPAQARPLVESIVQLDAEFQAGQMADEAYRRKREALKGKLRGMVQQ